LSKAVISFLSIETTFSGETLPEYAVNPVISANSRVAYVSSSESSSFN